MKNQLNKKQTFRLSAPTAQNVMLVGDFTHWQKNGISMQKGNDGVWNTTIELPPGKHTYRFMVDGQWQDDPECTLRIPNPFGGQNMVYEAT